MYVFMNYFVIFFSYEQSETHSSEVMRMLMDDPDELEEYVMNSKDKYVCTCICKCNNIKSVHIHDDFIIILYWNNGLKFDTHKKEREG